VVIMSSLSFFRRINRTQLELFLDRPMVEIVAVMQNCGLIRSHFDCPKCKIPCKNCRKPTPTWPGFGWRCPSCVTTYSGLTGSWFFRMRQDIRLILRMLYSFCWEQASLKSLQHELRQPNDRTIAKQTHTDYLSFFREICSIDNDRQPPIGGFGTIVEIDESAVCKRKHNRGKRIAPQQWLFGGVQRGDKKKLFVIPVKKRNAPTLLAAIAKFISPGTQIQSDCWAAYGRIGRMGKHYQHPTVNHSMTFKFKINGACTNTIEGLWQKIKLPHKVRYGTHRTQLASWVAAAVWNQRHDKPDRFEAILAAI
ncbi:hypothetical protein PFISCL1PPCAC_16426, partial [Pristionchus fissidentatus]